MNQYVIVGAGAVGFAEGVLARLDWPDGPAGEGIVHRALWFKAGTRILQPPEDFDLPMLGYVIAVGRTYEEVQARLMAEVERVRLEWA